MPSPVIYALQILTLAMWLTCAGVGATGLSLGWPQPMEKQPEPPAVVATLVDTTLVEETPPETPASTEPTPPTESLPQPPRMQDLPDLPPLQDLPAFVEKRVPPSPPPPPSQEPKPRKSEEKVKPPPAARAATGTPAAQTLVMGQGEGRQPAPVYPADARARSQQGTVVVQFLVGADGRVLSAEAWQPSPWPMLNESAVRTVRSRWHFSAGAVRLYRVPITFRLQR